MNTQIDTLRRLHRIFFPELPPPLEWYERLAALVQEHTVDDADIIAYFHALSLHKKGLSCGNPAVTDGIRARLATLKHFGSRVTLVVPTTASEGWLEHVIDFYNDINVPVAFAVDARTSDESRGLLSAKGAVCIDMGQDQQVDFLTPEIFKLVGTDWILRLDDDELPAPAVLNFVDKAVEHAPEFVWGFPRVHCRYDNQSGELQYSQFLPFGPFAKADLQWRLMARPGTPTQQRAAGREALLLSFDWVVRSFVERVARLKCRDGQTIPSLAPLYLQEAIPENWHMFAPLPNQKYKEFARRTDHTRTQKREGSHDDSAGTNGTQSSIATGDLLSKDPVILRDELIAEASCRFAQSDIAGGMTALTKLRWATIDSETLARTDPYLAQISAGKRIVATCDPRRIPAENEIVIVYGNYPHIFENVVVNNPIKRHVATFGEFNYHEVEYDRRWDGVGQIYIINADHRPDRYDAVLRELASARAPFHRITRIPAIRDETTRLPPVDGQIGCLRSHIETLRRAKAEGLAHTLVLEDDFCFTTEIDAHMDDLQTFLRRGYEYLICLLATSKYGRIIAKDDLVSFSLQPCTNTGAYLVSAAGIDQLLPVQEFALERLKETHDTVTYSVDRCWSVLQASGQFLVFRRKFGFQSSSFSDIERSISRYLD